MRYLIAALVMISGPLYAAPPVYDGSLIAWDYTARSDLRGFECRVGERIVGQAGPRSRSMRLPLAVDGEQTVSCRAISSDSALSSDPVNLLVDYVSTPVVPAPTFFCRTISGASCELSWTYSGTPREFVLLKDGAVVGKAGPGAATMPCPALPSGSHTLALYARSTGGADSAQVEIVRTYPEPDGVACNE